MLGSGEQIFTRSRSVVSRVVAGETLIVPVRGKVGDLASIYSFNGSGFNNGVGNPSGGASMKARLAVVSRRMVRPP